eukprot:3844095-Pleurochrysis_carterae.AAC.6
MRQRSLLVVQVVHWSFSTYPIEERSSSVALNTRRTGIVTSPRPVPRLSHAHGCCLESRTCALRGANDCAWTCTQRALTAGLALKDLTGA